MYVLQGSHVYSSIPQLQAKRKLQDMVSLGILLQPCGHCVYFSLCSVCVYVFVVVTDCNSCSRSSASHEADLQHNDFRRSSKFSSSICSACALSLSSVGGMSSMSIVCVISLSFNRAREKNCACKTSFCLAHSAVNIL